MKSFNLSDWALSHRSLVWYFMLISVIAGVASYLNLGREEDPAFAIKTMTITVVWPGATAKETRCPHDGSRQEVCSCAMS